MSPPCRVDRTPTKLSDFSLPLRSTSFAISLPFVAARRFLSFSHCISTPPFISSLFFFGINCFVRVSIPSLPSPLGDLTDDAAWSWLCARLVSRSVTLSEISRGWSFSVRECKRINTGSSLRASDCRRSLSSLEAIKNFSGLRKFNFRRIGTDENWYAVYKGSLSREFNLFKDAYTPVWSYKRRLIKRYRRRRCFPSALRQPTITTRSYVVCIVLLLRVSKLWEPQAPLCIRRQMASCIVERTVLSSRTSRKRAGTSWREDSQGPYVCPAKVPHCCGVGHWVCESVLNGLSVSDTRRTLRSTPRTPP